MSSSPVFIILQTVLQLLFGPSRIAEQDAPDYEQQGTRNRCSSFSPGAFYPEEAD
jgi:hypothetical protein